MAKLIKFIIDTIQDNWSDDDIIKMLITAFGSVSCGIIGIITSILYCTIGLSAFLGISIFAGIAWVILTIVFFTFLLDA